MTCDYIKLANDGIQQLKPYEPGKPIDELERELGLTDIVKLASNENPLGPSHKALDVLRHGLGDLHLYPDGAGFGLKAALADSLNVATDQLTLGNGSNDILDLVARAYLQPGDEAIFSEYGFAIYPLVTLACSAKPVMVPSNLYGHDLAAMADAVTDNTRVIFVANPNNPTGTWFNAHALDEFLSRVPERVIVVLDEAYFEYVEESHYPNGIDRLQKYPNLVVTRTFSKIHGLAGLRVGYGISSPQIADVLNRIRQPFNVNTLALRAAEAALGDNDHLENSRSENTTGLVQIAEGLDQLGLEQIPSVANFIAFDCGRPAQGVYEALLREAVIVRPLGGYGMPNHLRVTVGTSRENERFLIALKKVLADG
ncbi:histidinol-phosphate aminotransferase [Alcanivorax hongdengensis A-11-3]|uniref:Histidinol-phosphate aminotransferase n=1 Tax=Alcanivorax hongdengensis A-11-3 TaxID=1177179 RepID=L0W971_9GAMM|nr:histidinol-phosphate transaminase [Alcanivorax hongdengensis]EKF73481.1 histidinol-phosphate aminotransferase [Alcanivorax hongdengensis A-11-3]